MNVDSRRLLAEGERAVQRGWNVKARTCFREAGEAAATMHLWHAALRCYCLGLELDLLDRELVNLVLALPPHVTSARGWSAYTPALATKSLSFGCRAARITRGPRGAFVECPPIGPVLDVIEHDDHVEARAIRRFDTMPMAMAMLILRRALGGDRSIPTSSALSIRVTFAGTTVRLLDQGDWEPSA